MSGNLTAPAILCLHGNEDTDLASGSGTTLCDPEDLGMTPAPGSKELARLPI